MCGRYSITCCSQLHTQKKNLEKENHLLTEIVKNKKDGKIYAHLSVTNRQVERELRGRRLL